MNSVSLTAYFVESLQSHVLSEKDWRDPGDDSNQRGKFAPR
jgi:hypothetical protein